MYYVPSLKFSFPIGFQLLRISEEIVTIQSLSQIQPCACVTPLSVARQSSLSSTISQSLLKFMSIESVMLSNHLILCHPLLLLPSVFPSTRIFSSELPLHIRWPKYCSFSNRPAKEYLGLIFFRIDWFDLPADQGTLKSLLQHWVQKHQFSGTWPSLWSYSHICGLPLWLSWWRIHLQCRRPGLNPWLGRSSGEGKGYPLQYSGLKNSMDCTVHGVTKSRTQLSNFHTHTHIHICTWLLEKP